MKKENRNYWFYLDSYAHVKVQTDDVLIYNPLNGKAVVEKGNPEAAALMNRLTAGENLYVTAISADELAKDGIARLVSQVQESLMGDLMDAETYPGKPIQIPPKLKIMKGSEKHPDQVSGNKGMHVVGNLRNLTIYLNNIGAQTSHPFPGEAYKQFAAPCFCFGGAEASQLPLEPLLAFLDETRTTLLERLNIMGGDIFAYENLPQLLQKLNRIPVYKAYYFHYPQLANRKLEDINFQGELDVLVDFPVQSDQLARAVESIEAAETHARYQFIIQEDADLDAADALIERHGYTDYSYMPYYNGKNLDFFRDGVFVRPEDIMEAKPSQKEILKRAIMNTANFGRLTVLSNGDIHANLNHSRIGVLGQDTLYDVLYDEMNGGKSWWDVRSDVSPCKECIFQQMCPPISNYEYVIDRHDLCLNR
jgi:pseudo-rSAM protein